MNKESLYQSLNNQVVALIEDESNLIANLANVSALLNIALEDINWVGFYLLENDTLVLGPFQGNPACVRIPIGKGVCGTAFEKQQTLRIENVHDFEGHIACDAASNSEIVIPLIKDGQYIGVLDIDSPSLNRFDEDDQAGLELIMSSLKEYL
ncbi:MULTISPECIES: GAF domain-containing protein [unclassified Pseudoalteromonas]|uniref:GAF domain-containing protein n=1 Tax=unclassified Pseudoalteromonas TaxID=194690 RepID=UPI00237DEF28|nr:GAF domain-containing protein [Pseudoalteromonas sp. G4]MDE3273239.1 GAF domain-containing protein [Pseudoalteromonas sp. G4]